MHERTDMVGEGSHRLTDGGERRLCGKRRVPLESEARDRPGAPIPTEEQTHA